MLDEILDLFERDKKKSGATKQGGVRGLLNRFNSDDSDRQGCDEQQRRYVDDDDRDGRSKPHKKRREFDFFGGDD